MHMPTKSLKSAFTGADITYLGYQIYAILISRRNNRVAINPHIWQSWADTLYRWGAQEVVATLLEAFGPLNLVGAQVVYFGQPFLRMLLPEDHVNAFASLLDNPQETQAFTHFLRYGLHTESVDR
jgi:hypothetical protein